MAYTQKFRRIAVETPLGEDVLLLSSFTGEEGVSRLFRFELNMLSENESVDFDGLVGENVTIRVTLPDASDRYFNGQISRFAQGGRDRDFATYHAEMVPWLWFLTRSAGCRIFQNKKAPDIIQQVFDDLGFQDYALRLYGSFPEREYCVQYRETDFNFVSRLMEEEGIFYFFEHDNGKHTLVLSNDSGAHKPCPKQERARYELTGGGSREDDVILEWESSQELRPGKYALQDYNFEDPSTDLFTQVSGTGDYRIYDYPGEYRKRAEGDRLARLRLDETHTPAKVITGASDCRAFTSGYRFHLEDHYRDAFNSDYVLTLVRHSASQGGDFRSGGGEEGEFHYRNTFECIPLSTPFRPPRLAPHPVVQGSQTAVVVGPGGEEIFTDKYGRVKVQFYWDRLGKMDDKSSCWIRVAQPWAGKGWGTVFIPRIGQEVIVHFLEGDPDRPIITGCVYNAEQMPPYDLPGEKNKSTIKSLSTKGGGGFNEFRLDDTKGTEQIFLNAERNFDLRVKKDRFETIGGGTNLIVGGDQLEKIQGDCHLKVTGDQNEKIGGTISQNAAMDIQAKAGMNYAMDAGMEIHLKAGMNLVIESGVTLTLKVGGNFVNLNPAGVFIQGTMVMINSGGAAGSGSGSSPQGPKDPAEADKAKPGQLSHLSPPAPPAPVKVRLKPTKFGPAAAVLQLAAQSGAPFCDI